MKKLLLFICLFLSINGMAQDTIYYKSQGKITSSKSEASTYKVIYKNALDTTIFCEKEFLISGQIYLESNYKSKKRDGIERKWYKNGQLQWELNYTQNKLDGSVKSYWPNGRARRNDLYQLDKVLSGQCFGMQGADTTYYPYMIMPEYPGGLKSLYEILNNNIVYPNLAKRNGIQGKVMVQFVVDKDGNVIEPKIIKSSNNTLLDDEAFRVVSLMMPKWIPGRIEGQAVRMKMTIPVVFRINNN